MDDDTAPAAPQTAVWASHPALLSIAQNISQQWHLPYINDPATDAHVFVLCVTPNAECEYQLELLDTSHVSSRLHIDYAHGEIAYRAQHGGGRKQALAKAIGMKPGILPAIIDATAGLGRDAFVLANLGCTVTMIERSPVMACLLADALRRATYDEFLKPWITRRLQMVTGDAQEQIPILSSASPADAIYIDPMYPPREKSALVKKEMRFIQALVGKDMDSAALLDIALKHAKNRVVIKRPSYATPVPGPKPSHTIESKNTRYDVYMIH